MKRYVALLCLSLAACSDSSAIEDAVRENLIDPDSAKFGEVIKYKDDDGTDYACVEVNAKNRLGGYTGEKIVNAMRSKDGSWIAGGGMDAGIFGGCAGYVEYKNKPDE